MVFKAAKAAGFERGSHGQSCDRLGEQEAGGNSSLWAQDSLYEDSACRVLGPARFPDAKPKGGPGNRVLNRALVTLSTNVLELPWCLVPTRGEIQGRALGCSVHLRAPSASGDEQQLWPLCCK